MTSISPAATLPAVVGDEFPNFPQYECERAERSFEITHDALLQKP